MSERPKTFYQQEVERIAQSSPLPHYLYVQVRQSREFMEKYHADRIDSGEMAAAACMSRFHYIRTFRRIYGVTPRQYLRDLRIAKAKALLKKGLPVTQVCLDVGYESLATFSRSFRRCTGHSPREYNPQQKSNRE